MTKINKLPFAELFKLFGKELPNRSHFFGDGRHNLTFLQVLKYYRANNMAKAWPEFVRDYNLHAKQFAVEKVVKKEGIKDESTAKE